MVKKPTLTPTNKRVNAAQPNAITLEMVAQEAGVSPATVSRIVNGSAVVSSARKQAVDAAIAKLGFVPNPVARGLAGGRTFSIGVVTQALESPFYGTALRGIEETLLPLGYCPLFVSGQWNAEVEKRSMDVLRSRRVDGIIVLAGRLSDEELKRHAKSLPIVVAGRNLKAKGLLALNFDHTEGARLATTHLIGLGHRNIACIAGDPLHPDAVERLEGYRIALAQAGIAYQPKLVVDGNFLESSGVTAANALLQSGKPFSAIFAANDQMAVGAVLALSRRGLRVPEDVSVIGFDDLPTSLYANPPLTTVHHPAYELGQLAAKAMLELLAGRTLVMQAPAPRLVCRESCRALAA